MRVQDSRPKLLGRRKAIGLLGVGAGLGLVAALEGEAGLASAALQGAAASSKKLTFPKGAIIRTILKDLPPEALAGGATLFHEHLSVIGPPHPYQPQSKEPIAHSVTENVDLMVDEVRAAAKEGVACIVDAGTRDLGRNVDHLRTISIRSGVPIVASGGLYLQADYPPDVATKTDNELADEFVRDAHAERWGAFGEIGSSLEMSTDERKVFIAISKAHLRTNLPIFTHTPHQGCQKCALDQLDIFTSQGVDPRRICIGHLSDITDDPQAETPKAIAKRGAFVGFDTVGLKTGQPDSKKVAMCLAVIDAGYEDHVLLSSDINSAPQMKINGGSGYATALVVFVPKLRAAGVKEATIHKILVDNPRRFLAFVPKTSS